MNADKKPDMPNIETAQIKAANALSEHFAPLSKQKKPILHTKSQACATILHTYTSISFRWMEMHIF